MKSYFLLIYIFLYLKINSQEIPRLVFLDTLENNSQINESNRNKLKFISPFSRYDTLYVGIVPNTFPTFFSIYAYFSNGMKLNGGTVILEYLDRSEDCFIFSHIDDNNRFIFRIINDLRYIKIKTPIRIKFRDFVVYTIHPEDTKFFINFFNYE